MQKITKRFIDGLWPKPDGDLFAWDSELKGFGVRMKPSGVASFLVQYRTPQGKTRCYAFRKVGTLTPDEARTKARRRVARHIKPLVGSNVAGKLTRPIVQRMADAIAAGKTVGAFKTKTRGVARVTGGPGTAARVIELLGGIWSWAEKRGFVSGPNPAHGIETQRAAPRDRTLDARELAALGAALQGEGHSLNHPDGVTPRGSMRPALARN